MNDERYDIKGKIGQGGIGAVYRAFDRRLNRDVAIKRVLPEGGFENQEEAIEHLGLDPLALAQGELAWEDAIAMAVARFSRGNRSAIMEWLAGLVPASPTPTPIRKMANCQAFMATPQRAVMTEKSPRHQAISFLRTVRSASSARGTPIVA